MDVCILLQIGVFIDFREMRVNMKSINNLDKYPASLPILSDDVVEFHAARLLLLFKLCGVNGSIDGLTKMAKLDFFVRYPNFFYTACQVLGENVNTDYDFVESKMVRYHYGPWDRRYYHILAYLKSKRLLRIEKYGNRFDLSLTFSGDKIASHILEDQSYKEIADHMRKVKSVLGDRKGSELKQFIYEVFDTQIAQRSLDEVIE